MFGILWIVSAGFKSFGRDIDGLDVSIYILVLCVVVFDGTVMVGVDFFSGGIVCRLVGDPCPWWISWA